MIRAPEFASVSFYLSIAVDRAVNCLIIIRSAKKTVSANALEMTISSWSAQSTLSASLFALNRRRASER